MSLRLRIALLTAAAVAVIAVAIAASIYLFMSYRLHAQVEQDLRISASLIRDIVSATGGLPPLAVQDPGRAPFIPRLISADGRVVGTGRGGAVPDIPLTAPARSVAAGDAASVLETVRVGAADFYVLTEHIDPGRALQVARSLVAVQDILQQLLLAAIAFGAAGIVAALLAGAAVATGALVPLRRLSRASERITITGDLTQRVGAGGRDELARFARSFDAMLDRLEAMVKEVERAQRMQRQLVADASHELRAPLATLRANVELLSLGSEARVGDREQLLADALAGIEDLTSLVGQLIDLAREDQREHQRVLLRLDDLVDAEVERVRRRYPHVDFVTTLDQSSVVGDAEALARAIANLLDNAAKWSPAGGTVQVHLRDGVLEVRDHGPGIDPADLPHIFDRFYRGARAAGVPGSGLGLAIVSQVMSAHGGRVSAESASGGTVFRASFVPSS